MNETTTTATIGYMVAEPQSKKQRIAYLENRLAQMEARLRALEGNAWRIYPENPVYYTPNYWRAPSYIYKFSGTCQTPTVAEPTRYTGTAQGQKATIIS